MREIDWMGFDRSPEGKKLNTAKHIGEILATIEQELSTYGLPIDKDLPILKEKFECLSEYDFELLNKLPSDSYGIYIKMNFFMDNYIQDEALTNLHNAKTYYNDWEKLLDEAGSILSHYNAISKQILTDKNGYKVLESHIDTARRNLLATSILSFIFIHYNGTIDTVNVVKITIPKQDVLFGFLILLLYFGGRFFIFLMDSDLKLFTKNEGKQLLKNITKWNDVSKKVLFRIFNFYIPLLIGMGSVLYTLWALYNFIINPTNSNLGGHE